MRLEAVREGKGRVQQRGPCLPPPPLLGQAVQAGRLVGLCLYALLLRQDLAGQIQ